MMKWYLLIFPLIVWAASIEEQVGSLFVIPICPKRGEDHIQDVERVIREYHIRAVIVKQATPEEQLKMLQRLGPGLFVFQDAEWGLGMRMDGDVISFPKNGFLKSEELIYRIGKEIARELRIIGCHVNLSPVADVNSNPKNMIIGMRSFGSNPHHVAACSVAMMKGLQEGGIMACGKHFPGHGDVEIDSHLALPTVYKTKSELYEAELIPFQALIDAGVCAIMTAHLNTPYIDPIQVLREELGFKGLVISDAMNMGGVIYSPEEAAILYLKSGHDLLLYGDHIAPNVDHILHEMVPRAYKAVVDAVKRGEIVIEDKLERIEAAKALWLHPKEEGELNTVEARLLKEEREPL